MHTVIRPDNRPLIARASILLAALSGRDDTKPELLALLHTKSRNPNEKGALVVNALRVALEHCTPHPRGITTPEREVHAARALTEAIEKAEAFANAHGVDV